MTLLTGVPLGNIVTQDELFIEGAPYIYYQAFEANLLNRPDANGFYWGLSGTTTYPVYELACYEDVSLADDLTINAVRCDQIGDRDVIMKRNHLVFSFSLSSLFPLTSTTALIRGGAVTTSASPDRESMGLGPINNAQAYHIYLPKVYDDLTGDLLIISLPRAKFVDPWTIAMVSGDKWMLGGISAWALATSITAAGQEFATIIRQDPSLL